MTLAQIRWDMILGGFGLFMFGINFMGDSLKEFAGDKLKYYIDKYTSNPFSAFLIGIVITIIMQSSSASTAITIGMVRAGLMTLEQAAGIVMGANIGTTITSFLISLDFGQYILYVIFAGAMVSCFAKSKKKKALGNIFLGFGLVFYGLNSMGDELAYLKDIPEFTQIAETMSQNPVLSLLAGVVMTGAIQASAATIGIVQKMYQAGALTFQAVLPFVFGANIGTTVTGILAAIGGSTAAKRTAGIHTLFNIVGTVIGMLLLTPMSNFILWLADMLGMNEMMQVAVSHIIFNSMATLLFFPFLKQMCALIRKVIPGDEPKRMQVNVDGLDVNLAKQFPSAALGACHEVILQMAGAVRENVEHSCKFLNEGGGEEATQVIEQEESLINEYDKKITTYLIDVSAEGTLSENDTVDQRLQLEAIKNLERIGDLTMNLVEFFDMIHESKDQLTSQAVQEINDMYDHFLKMYDLSVHIFKTGSHDACEELEKLEDQMDRMEYEARLAHFDRMKTGVCTSPVAESVYCDILGNLERMGDHCWNIAKSTLTRTVDDLHDDGGKSFANV